MFLELACLYLLSNSITTASVARPRIIGGELARAGQFPWATAIYKTTADGNYFCGGALLHHDWVITAAQCVDSALLLTLYLGSTKLQGDANQQRLATDTYYLHPNYNPETLQNDIALIKFRESITLNDYIGRIFLPYFPVDTGFTTTAVGWGQLSDTEAGLVDDLHYVELSALSNEECRLYYGVQISDNMLCAAGQYNEGTCYGDTGGALMMPYGINAQAIVGVSIFISSNGCESVNPSGYTRVYPYIDWILNVTDSLS